MWRRGLACLIDFAVMWAILSFRLPAYITPEDDLGPYRMLTLFFYFWALEYHYGATLGKMAVGLRVALPWSVNPRWSLFYRTFVKIFCMLPPLCLAAAIIGIVREDQRTFTDFASGSTVIDSKTWAMPRRMNFYEQLAALMIVILGPIVLLVCVMLGMAWMILPP